MLQSIRAGLRFAWSKGELMGSFVIDILAMTFGMPRALFPALALTVYHAGADRGGPALRGALGRCGGGGVHDRLARPRAAARPDRGRDRGHLGCRITIMGLTNQLWVAMVCLVIAGAADSISAVCRSTILQTATPDSMRGRMSSIFTMVVAGGPRLGDVESGTVAGAVGLRFSVVSGGLLCMLGILPIVAAFPAFWRYGQPQPEPERLSGRRDLSPRAARQRAGDAQATAEADARPGRPSRSRRAERPTARGPRTGRRWGVATSTRTRG